MLPAEQKMLYVLFRPVLPQRYLAIFQPDGIPGSVILNRTGDILYVANVKGTGSRNQLPDRKGHNSHDHLGSVSIIPLPGKEELTEDDRNSKHE